MPFLRNQCPLQLVRAHMLPSVTESQVCIGWANTSIFFEVAWPTFLPVEVSVEVGPKSSKLCRKGPVGPHSENVVAKGYQWLQNSQLVVTRCQVVPNPEYMFPNGPHHENFVARVPVGLKS